MSTTSHGKSARLRPWLTAIVALGGATLLAACGSGAVSGTAGQSASQPATAPASSPSISCTQITSLRTALTKLSHTTVSDKSASQIRADLATVETDLTALKSDTTAAFSAVASQVSAALSKVSDDAQGLAQHPTAANLRATTRALDQLKAAAQPAIAAMGTICPSS